MEKIFEFLFNVFFVALIAFVYLSVLTGGQLPLRIISFFGN
jgi:hypothetical protein